MSTPQPVKWFDSLSAADFRNGAIRDEIREYISDWIAFDKRIAALESQLAVVTAERDALRTAKEVGGGCMHLAHECATERDSLRAALVWCAEALRYAERITGDIHPITRDAIAKALADPVVVAVMKDA